MFVGSLRRMVDMSFLASKVLLEVLRRAVNPFAQRRRTPKGTDFWHTEAVGTYVLISVPLLL